MNEIKLKETAASLLKDMETTAARMRELIVAMPPHDLLGYIYAQHMMKVMADQNAIEQKRKADGPDDLINENQFLLEYVHAVLASDAAPADVTFDEAQCAELFQLGRKLREQAMFFAMATSADTKDGVFGPDTADIEFRAKSTWVMLRGNRYQVLEEEFYRYVLTSHNDVLKEVYGVGAANIAEGFKKRGKLDKARYLNVAQGSVEERRYYLILCADLGYCDSSNLQEKIEEVRRLLEGYTTAIRASIG